MPAPGTSIAPGAYGKKPKKSGSGWRQRYYGGTEKQQRRTYETVTGESYDPTSRGSAARRRRARTRQRRRFHYQAVQAAEAIQAPAPFLGAAAPTPIVSGGRPGLVPRTPSPPKAKIPKAKLPTRKRRHVEASEYLGALGGRPGNRGPHYEAVQRAARRARREEARSKKLTGPLARSFALEQKRAAAKKTKRTYRHAYERAVLRKLAHRQAIGKPPPSVKKLMRVGTRAAERRLGQRARKQYLKALNVDSATAANPSNVPGYRPTESEALVERMGLTESFQRLEPDVGEDIFKGLAEAGLLVLPGGGIAKAGREILTGGAGVRAAGRGLVQGSRALRGAAATGRVVRGGGRLSAKAARKAAARGGAITPKQLRALINQSRFGRSYRASRRLKVARRSRQARDAAQAQRIAAAEAKAASRASTRGAGVTRSSEAARAAQIARAERKAERVARARDLRSARRDLRAQPVGRKPFQGAQGGLGKRAQLLGNITTSNIAPIAALGGTKTGNAIATLPYHVGKAWIEDAEVRAETNRALEALPREFVSGVVRTAYLMVTDPTKVPTEVVEQYARTYGPLLSGDTATFRQRLSEPGSGGIVGPVLDVVFLAAPAGSFAAGSLARRGFFGARQQRIHGSERPLLQTSGGSGSRRRQYASRRWIKRMRQYSRDMARAEYAAQKKGRSKEAGRLEDTQDPIYAMSREIEADRKRGEIRGVVTPRGTPTKRLHGHQIALTPGLVQQPYRLAARGIARLKGRAISAAERDRNRFIEAKRTDTQMPGAGQVLDELEDTEVAALHDIAQIGADPDNPRAFVAALGERARQIREHNQEVEGSDHPFIPRARRAEHDELDMIENILEAVKDGSLRMEDLSRATKELHALQNTLEHERFTLSKIAAHDGLSQAEMRVMKPYVEFLVRWDDKTEAGGGKRILPAFDGEFHDPEFGTYINDLVRPSKKTGGQKYFGVERLLRAGKKRGLREPFFVPSERRLSERPGLSAIGGSKGYMGKREHRYEGALFRSGRQARSREVFLQGIRRGIKDKAQAKMLLEAMDEHGFSVLREHKAQVVDWMASVEATPQERAERYGIQGIGGQGLIPDTIRESKGYALNLRKELRTETDQPGDLGDQFDTLYERGVIDPWHVAKAWLAEQKATHPDRDFGPIDETLEAFRPTQHPADSGPLSRLEIQRREDLVAELEKLNALPPLLRALADAEKRRYETLQKVQPMGEAKIVKSLKGDFNGELMRQFDTADKLRAFMTDTRTAQLLTENIREKYFAGDDDAYGTWLNEMREQIYTKSQESFKARGFGPTILLYRVGPHRDGRPLAVNGEGVLHSFTADPTENISFRIRGKHREQAYEIDTSSLVVDVNAFVHKQRTDMISPDEEIELGAVDQGAVMDATEWQRLIEEAETQRAHGKKEFEWEGETIDADAYINELYAQKDAAMPEGKGAWEPRYHFENEVLAHPRDVRPVTHPTLSEQAQQIKHATQLRESLTIKQLYDSFDELGWDTSRLAFFNPGLMYNNPRMWRAVEDFGDAEEAGEGSKVLGSAFEESLEDGQGLDKKLAASAEAAKKRGKKSEGEPPDFHETTGYIAIPKEVMAELEPVLNRVGARLWDIGKNKASRVLLGLANFSWLGFQIGANAFLTGAAGVGPLEMFRANRWWHALDADTKRSLEPILNIEPHIMDTRNRYMGFEMLNSSMSQRIRAFQESDVGNFLHEANFLRRIMDASFKFDRWQTAHFRRAIFYNRLKREAIGRMGHNGNKALRLQRNMKTLWNPDFDLPVMPMNATGPVERRKIQGGVEGMYRTAEIGGPEDPSHPATARAVGTPDPSMFPSFPERWGQSPAKTLHEQMNRFLENKQVIEDHAATVNDWLGDYTTFSAMERQTLQRFVMFYGFMRHSLRLTLWTLPTRHPIMVGILGKLALLSDKETRELLGLEDLPFSLASFTLNTGDKLVSVNLSRMSPAGNVMYSANTPFALLGVLPPAFTVPAAALGFDFFTGKFAQVRGENRFEAAERGLGGSLLNFDPSEGLTIEDRFKLFLSAFENIIPPARMAKAYTMHGPQGRDATLIFGGSPTELTEAKAEIEKQIGRELDRGVLGWLGEQFGVREIDPGYIKYLQELEQEKRKKKRSSGGGGGGINSPSSSGGGGGGINSPSSSGGGGIN